MELRKWRSHEGDLMWTVNMDGTERVLDTNLDDILCSEDPLDFVLATTTSFRLPSGSTLIAPIDKQEIWASGVTYERSRDARMEESKQGGDFYDLVYDADRPELFFKASPWRETGPGVQRPGGLPSPSWRQPGCRQRWAPGPSHCPCPRGGCAGK